MKATYKLYRPSEQKDIEVQVEEISSCPLCHCGGHPHFEDGCMISNHEGKQGVHLFIILYCTICKKHFIVKYFGFSGKFELEYALPSNDKPTEFDEIINNISPDFVNIYNQAKQAEEMALTELVGVGYRKALEFLVKDYLICKQNEKPEQIKKLLLGDCVKKIQDNKIHILAKGATWIGNDETHYERRHVDYGTQHLKLFIKTLVEFIVGEESFKQALSLVEKT